MVGCTSAGFDAFGHDGEVIGHERLCGGDTGRPPGNAERVDRNGAKRPFGPAAYWRCRCSSPDPGQVLLDRPQRADRILNPGRGARRKQQVVASVVPRQDLVGHRLVVELDGVLQELPRLR